MDLREAGVGEQCTLAVGPPDGSGVRRLGVRRQVEDVAVAAGREHHGVRAVALHLTGVQMAGDDPAGAAILHDELEHLGARVDGDASLADLLSEGLVRPEQQLLTGLAPGVERATHLRAAKTAIVEQAAVLAGEGDALRNALVDDVDRQLGEPVYVRLAGAEVAALHRVVEEAEDRVAVALVVLGGVDAALRGDRMRAPGRVVEREAMDVVAHLAQRRGGGPAGEAGADHDDLEAAPVVGRDQLHVELVLVPLLLDRSTGDVAVQLHLPSYLPAARPCAAMPLFERHRCPTSCSATTASRSCWS